MRKSLIFLPLSFVLAFAVSAQQHIAAPAAPSAPVHVAAPPPAPVHSAAAPVMHAAPIHPPVAVHPVSRTPVSNVTPVVPHRRKPNPSPSNPTIGSTGHSGPGYPVLTRCNQHFSYPIQGLNACPPPLTPVFGGAYFIPVPYYYGDSGVQDQELPQSNEEQVAEEAPVDNQQEEIAGNQDQSDLDRQPTPEQHVHAGSSTLNDPLAEFVFVERDGSKLYAVAYSFLDNRLHYVTKEGVRHTVALDSLDLDATQKFNEQLGNTINLPSLPPSGDA